MYDIIIIGGGPAGLTAALYAKRANKNVLLIEKETFGGQITFSPKVENIPGFNSLSGNEFAEKLVPISDFSQGKAGKIFSDVAENNNEYIVLKNNQPIAVVMSIKEYVETQKKSI